MVGAVGGLGAAPRADKSGEAAGEGASGDEAAGANDDDAACACAR